MSAKPRTKSKPIVTTNDSEEHRRLQRLIAACFGSESQHIERFRKIPVDVFEGEERPLVQAIHGVIDQGKAVDDVSIGEEVGPLGLMGQCMAYSEMWARELQFGKSYTRESRRDDFRFAGEETQRLGIEKANLLYSELKDPTTLQRAINDAIQAGRDIYRRDRGKTEYTDQELADLELPETRWLVENLLPPGLVMLAGPPKAGKSYLGQHVARVVAEGGRLFGEFQVPEPAECLYVSLEGGARRLKRRQDEARQRDPAWNPAKIIWSTAWPRFDQGGIDELDRWLEAHPETRLIVFDTWVQVKPNHNSRRNSPDGGYAEAYADIEPLRDILEQRDGLTIMLVIHTGKAEKDDPLAEMIGSQGIGAAADAGWIYKRTRGGQTGTLTVIGNDVEEQFLAIESEGGGSFAYVGEGYRASIQPGSLRERIVELFDNGLNLELTTSEVARELDEEHKTNQVRNQLNNLVDSGQLTKDPLSRKYHLRLVK